MQIRSKFWLEVAGMPVFGKGKRSLLEAIDRRGSISRAAKEIHMPYRKAWSHLNAMEERLGVKLIERRAGGKHGGGAALTPDARKIMKKYVELEGGLQEIVDQRFKEIFG